jgi:acyl-CoA dehydrogenase family protein 9
MKYGKNIIDNEYPQARLANMVIHLYAMLAVISRTTSILNDEKIDDKKKEYCFNLAEHSLKRSRHIFVANLKGMTKNIDKVEKAISDQVAENGGYGLDIINY